MQGAERFGQPGFLFHPPEHVCNVAPRFVVVATGKNVGAFGSRQGGQDSAGLVVHGDSLCFAFLGNGAAQGDESPLKVKVVPLTD